MAAANPMDRIYFAPEKMSSSRIMEARYVPQERERKKMEELWLIFRMESLAKFWSQWKEWEVVILKGVFGFNFGWFTAKGVFGKKEIMPCFGIWRMISRY